LGLNNSESLDIALTEVKDILIVTDGVKLVGINLNDP